MKKVLFLLVLALGILTFTSCEECYDEYYRQRESCTYCGCGAYYTAALCDCCCHDWGHPYPVKWRGDAAGSGCCHRGWKSTRYDPLNPGAKSASAVVDNDSIIHVEDHTH